MSARKSPRERLVDLLRAAGVHVEWHDFWCQEGGYRKMDLARWGVCYAQPCIPLQAAAGPCSGMYHIHSWDTMTNCARRGIEILVDGTEIEVGALRGPALF